MLLPKEAKRIAEKLRLSLKRFLQEKCVLAAYLYPRQQGRGLTLNSELLPKRVARFAEKELGALPPRFLLLPCIALKRKRSGECIFLRNGKCEIHSVAPQPCRSFPFLTTSRKPLRLVYPFCPVLQQNHFQDAIGSVDRTHKSRVGNYFNAVEKQGFLSQWKFLPPKCVFLFEGKKELRGSRKEFLQLAGPLL